MRVLGAAFPPGSRTENTGEPAVVLLDDAGSLAKLSYASSLPEVAATVGQLTAGEPFLLGVNVPVVVPARPVRTRPVENVVRRRLGTRLPPGGRGATGAESGGVIGETLMAGLAAAGQPCLPYPDRDRRRPGLAETYADLILKSLLWESSALAADGEQSGRDELFRAYAAPSYRGGKTRARSGWAERSAGLDMTIRILGSAAGFDLQPTADALARTRSAEDVERAVGLFEATLIAGTARRYLDAPETCLFLGDHERGYVILPAGVSVRRLAMTGAGAARGRLFPQTSLRERLGQHAQLRAADLLNVPGRPQRTEASFKDPPGYEFDNLDEMLWWKHCRHVAGVNLPTDGLQELVVSLQNASAGPGEPLRLSRSRHRTLSFRFEPPAAWRRSVPTRDGKTYPFRVLRAVYETLPAAD